MFGHRYFGARHYGPRYFGDGGDTVVVAPVSTGQSFTPRRRLRSERFPIAISLEAIFDASVEAVVVPPIVIVASASGEASVRSLMRFASKAFVESHGEAHVSGQLVEYNEIDELSILGLL